MIAKKSLLLSGALLSLAFLPACTAALLQTDALGIFQKQDVNLTEKNYAAADFLVQQAETFIRDRDLIKATVLTDADQNVAHSKLGRIISEQVGVRMSQLGYHMDLSEVSKDEGLNYRKPGKSASQSPSFIVSGSYFRGRLDLDVSLRIIELRTSRVVAVFDYTIPMTREIAELSEPETRIFKISE